MKRMLCALCTLAAVTALFAQSATLPLVSDGITWTVFDFKSTADWKTQYPDRAPVALVQDNKAGTLTLNIPASRDVELAIFDEKVLGMTTDLSMYTTLVLTLENPSKRKLQFTIYGGSANATDYKPSGKFRDKELGKGTLTVECPLSSLSGLDLKAVKHLIVQVYNNGGTEVKGLVIKDVSLR